MTAREDLGLYLHACRKQIGLRQEDAARALSVDASQISRWENARQLPKQSRAKDLARIYKVGLAEMREKIGAAWEEESAEHGDALAVFSQRLDAMKPMLDEILKEVRRHPRS